MRTKKKKRFYIFTMVLIMIMSIMAATPAEAAGKKKLQSVSLKISGKNVTKKTYSMGKGKTAVVKAEVRPASAKKSVSYQSSDRRTVTVSRKGKITAKRNGTAKIRVTVKAKKGKKKTVWLKVKVVAARKKAPQASPSSCSHDWKFVRGEDVEQAPVYIARAKEYNVCKHCGYMGSYQEVAEHCLIFGGNWEKVPLGPEVKRQDWVCTDHYRCSRCGKEKTESHTEAGNPVTVYYRNNRLNWDVINNEMGRVKCPGCGDTSSPEWVDRDGGKCICGRELYYTEEDIFYPWNLSKAYPELEDEHYKEVDKDGKIVILK